MTSFPERPNWVEIQDLLAQQSMSRIAEQVLLLTWLQVIVGIIGAVALIYTLRESRKATATALKSVRVQQTSERGVLVVKSVKLYLRDTSEHEQPWNNDPERDGAVNEVTASAILINKGKSLAMIRRSRIQLLVDEKLPAVPEFSKDASAPMHNPVDIGETFAFAPSPLQLSAEESKQFQDGAKKVWLFGSVEYDDLFSERHKVGFCYNWQDGRTFTPEEDGGRPFWPAY